MDNKNGNFQDFSMAQAMKLANSEAGKQLLNRLQQQNGSELERAVAQASSGDMTMAKQTLSRLLADPETVRLLNKLKE